MRRAFLLAVLWVLAINIVEGQTKVFMGPQPSAATEVRAGAHVRAVIDDACRTDAGACTASEVTIEKVSGISRIEAVKERAGEADAELDKGKDSAAPGMAALGGGRGDARDAEMRDDCPLGMIPLLKDGQRVMDENGHSACRVKRQFIKGELTNLGSDKLVVADSRFGIGFGYAHLDNSSYLAISPEIDLHFGDQVALGIGVPLNIRAYADGFYDTGKIRLRKHDYDNPSDYARILRFLTVNRKEDQFYLNISQVIAGSIGHGALVRRYSGNVDQNITRVGAELDAYWKYGGFEAYVGDVVQPQHFLGSTRRWATPTPPPCNSAAAARTTTRRASRWCRKRSARSSSVSTWRRRSSGRRTATSSPTSTTRGCSTSTAPTRACGRAVAAG